MLESILIIAMMTVVIWWFSEKLEGSARIIGHRLKMPDSVKGAVLYAVPSSFPELCTATISVLFLETPVFEVGVGTIAGSAIFNILLIPALSVFVATAAMKKKGKKMPGIKISPHVFLRDGIFYFGVVGLFLAVALGGTMTLIISACFVALYGAYVLILYFDTKRHQKVLVERESRGDLPKREDEEKLGSLANGLGWMAVSLAAVGVACYFLVEHTLIISEELGLNPFIVAVILTAAATSIPDAFISMSDARKSGADAEASIINAFSSNIFDILICLSVPVLVFGGAVDLNVGESIPSLFSLAIITVIALACIRVGSRMTVAKGIFFVFLYACFVVTAIFNTKILELFGVEG